MENISAVADRLRDELGREPLAEEVHAEWQRVNINPTYLSLVGAGPRQL